MPLISLDDFELHYESQGKDDGQGEVVVCVHGLGSSGADWAFQVPALRERFRVITPDLRGAGLSGKPLGPYSIELFARDLWSLLDHLQVDRSHLVGFSLGGAVALEMALQQPSRAQRLVMINAIPSYRVDHWSKWLEAHMQIFLVRWLGLPRAARLVARRLFPEAYQAPMRRRVEQVVGQNARRPYLDTVRALMGYCAAGRLADLQSETLLLSGQFDYTAHEEKCRWAQRMKARIALVEGSRHGTPFDAIAATNQVLLAFLSGAGGWPDPLTVDGPESAPQAAPELPSP